MNKFSSKDRLRAIISFILSVLICLGLFFTATLADILIFSSPSFIRTCAEKSNYTEFAVSQLTDELNDLAMPSGLPDDFLQIKLIKKILLVFSLPALTILLRETKSISLVLINLKPKYITLLATIQKMRLAIFQVRLKRILNDFQRNVPTFIYLT